MASDLHPLLVEPAMVRRLSRNTVPQPGNTVHEVDFPAATSGEQTLRERLHEFKTDGPMYRLTVQARLRASSTRASSTGHYRRGLIALLVVPEFRSNNTTRNTN
jgi:hypothetical protein